MNLESQPTKKYKLYPDGCQALKKLDIRILEQDPVGLTLKIKGAQSQLDERGREYLELQGFAKSENKTYTIQLYHYFNQYLININDFVYVHFIPNTNIIKIENEADSQNFLVFDPFHLVPPTSLPDQYCMRKNYLQEWSKSNAYATMRPMFEGTVAHEFYQYLIRRDFQFPALWREIPQLEELRGVAGLKVQNLPPQFQGQFVDVYIQQIKNAYFLNLSQDELLQTMFEVLLNTIQFIYRYVVNKETLKVYVRNSSRYYLIKLLKTTKIEDYLSSVNFGFKGYVDVIMEAQITDQNGHSDIMPLPIELKSGKSNQNDKHEYQIQVYNILLEETEGRSVKLGLLQYLKDGKFVVVENTISARKQVIHWRNNHLFNLAKMQGKPMVIPNFTDQPNKCINCEKVAECSFFNMLYETQQPSRDHLRILEMKERMKPTTLKYIREFTEALQAEEEPLNKNLLQFKATIKNGKLELESIVLNHIDAQLLLYKLKLDETISLYNDKENFVVSLKSKDIRDAETECDEVNLIEDDPNDLQTTWHRVVLEISLRHKDSIPEGYLRVKLQDFTQFKKQRGALISLATSLEHQRKAEILILGLEPKFSELKPEDPRLRAFDILHQKFKSLNPDQRAAIELALKADDLALIMGYPGTGKTHTLVHLIYLLANMQKRVLVCSFTHQAVDVILEAFEKEFPKLCGWIVRLGTDEKKMSAKAQNYHFTFDNCKEVQRIKFELGEKRIFFSTCHAHSDLIQSEKFDYCIVDEASQVIEPLCIASILSSEKFILVGDYYQLSPLVKNRDADMLKVSLLQRLHERFDNCTAKLSIQYRMNSEIQKVANQLVYHNQLRLHKEDQNKMLGFKDLKRVKGQLEKMITGCRSVMFLNVRSYEHEIKTIQEICNILNQYGLSYDQYAVICAYNRAVIDLKAQLSKNINLMTIDKSQGSGYDCIVVGCSHEKVQSIHLLHNMQRINVACTRAKSKLILVGNVDQLKQKKDSTTDKLISVMEQNDWIYNL